MHKLNNDKSKQAVSVFRFYYNPEVRLNRYGLMATGFVVMLLIMWLRGDTLSVYLFLSIAGFVLCAILATEVWLLSARGRVIEIDTGRREIRLVQFVYPLSFLDIKPKPQVIIPFESVRGIEFYRSNKSLFKSYIVYTDRSKFSFSDYFTDTHRLIGLIEDIAKDTEPVHPARSMMLLSFGAGLLGLLIVALLGWMIGWI